MSDIDTPDSMKFDLSKSLEPRVFPENVTEGKFGGPRTPRAPEPPEAKDPAAMRFAVGDWVRFYKDGGFAIAQVEYLRKDPSGLLLLTDKGGLPEAAVIEIRRGAK